MNNKGVLKMVKEYFDELAFIYYELYKVCKDGAYVSFVNNNVRYAGEIISIDFISSSLCPRSLVLKYILHQQKGIAASKWKNLGEYL